MSRQIRCRSLFDKAKIYDLQQKGAFHPLCNAKFRSNFCQKISGQDMEIPVIVKQCLMVNRMSLIAHCGKAKFCQCHFVIHLASAHTHSFPKAKVQRCTVDEMHLFVTGLIFLLCQKRIDMLFALTFLLAQLCQNANFLLI